jgi:hypothetical protein
MKEPKQTADQRGQMVSRRGFIGAAAATAAVLATGTSKAMTPLKSLNKQPFKLR